MRHTKWPGSVLHHHAELSPTSAKRDNKTTCHTNPDTLKWLEYNRKHIHEIKGKRQAATQSHCITHRSTYMPVADEQVRDIYHETMWTMNTRWSTERQLSTQGARAHTVRLQLQTHEAESNRLRKYTNHGSSTWQASRNKRGDPFIKPERAQNGLVATRDKWCINK